MTPRVMRSKFEDETFIYYGKKIIRWTDSYYFFTAWLADLDVEDVTSDDRFLGYVTEPQQYKVTIHRSFPLEGTCIGAAMDCREWFDTALAVIGQNTVMWSLSLNDTITGETLDFEFSFSDLPAATLFRLRF